jgi:hypothetical protein
MSGGTPEKNLHQNLNPRREEQDDAPIRVSTTTLDGCILSDLQALFSDSTISLYSVLVAHPHGYNGWGSLCFV